MTSRPFRSRQINILQGRGRYLTCSTQRTSTFTLHNLTGTFSSFLCCLSRVTDKLDLFFAARVKMDSNLLSQSDLTVKISEAVLLQAALDWSKAEAQGQSLGVDLQLNIDIADREDFDLSSQEQSKRFGPKSSPADLAKLVASRVPANTQRNTRWGVEVCNAWRNYRCKSGNPVPDLTTGSHGCLLFYNY